jgi:hypothetical protein
VAAVGDGVLVGEHDQAGEDHHRDVDDQPSEAARSDPAVAELESYAK